MASAGLTASANAPCAGLSNGIGTTRYDDGAETAPSADAPAASGANDAGRRAAAPQVSCATRSSWARIAPVAASTRTAQSCEPPSIVSAHARRSAPPATGWYTSRGVPLAANVGRAASAAASIAGLSVRAWCGAADVLRRCAAAVATALAASMAGVGALARAARPRSKADVAGEIASPRAVTATGVCVAHTSTPLTRCAM